MPCTNLDEIPAATKIWRYMDLPKFIDLLRTSSLYFASLPTMEDEWEGAVAPLGDSTASVDFLLSAFGGTTESARSFIDSQERHNDASRAGVFINCWHRSEVESAAMWKLYEPTGRGIAIHSTVGHLCSSIQDAKESQLVEVQYVDFNRRGSLDVYNLDRRYSYKRESFRHEQELRLQHFDLMPLRPKTAFELAENPPLSEQSPTVDYENVIDLSTLPAGKHFSVDLTQLVQGLVVAPDAPGWFIEVVRDIAARYGHSFPVSSSAMLHRPRYGHF